MIKIRDVEILDMLPYTYNTNEQKALSKAISALTMLFYDTLSSVILWADIENASPNLLDAMAAEVDAPFYSSDMTLEQKRSAIAVTGMYNSRIGTVSSMTELLSASFGGGEIAEWYNYGGSPYYFKIKINSKDSYRISKEGFELFETRLDTVKPKRAKLEKAVFNRSAKNNVFVGAGILKKYKKIVVLAATTFDDERGWN